MPKSKTASRSQRTATTSRNLSDRLVALLLKFEKDLAHPDVRHQVRSLIPAYKTLRRLGRSLTGHQGNARDGLLAYLKAHPRQLIDSDELMVVAGIQDYPRRLREIRVEFGYRLYSGITFKAMSVNEPERKALTASLAFDPASVKPTQYCLLGTEPDEDAKRRWKLISTSRRETGSVKSKILTFLKTNVGRPVTGEELSYLSNGASEWARRVRELRTEEGWPIATCNTGRDDLNVGDYVLEANQQAEEHDRAIKDEVRVEVLERDEKRCRRCGWSHSQRMQGDPRQKLELHHIQHHAHGGANDTENLLTLCNVHHDSVHSGALIVIGPASKAIFRDC